ncbi:MAG: ATP-binding protein [Planctomycetota bacterium]
MFPPITVRTPVGPAVLIHGAACVVMLGLGVTGGFAAADVGPWAAVGVAVTACVVIAASARAVSAKLLRSVAIETQLDLIAAGRLDTPDPVVGPSPFADGWNRVVQLTRAAKARTVIAGNEAEDSAGSNTLDMLPLAVVRTDPGDAVTRANRMAALLFGTSASGESAEIVGKRLSELLPQADELGGSARTVASRTVEHGTGDEKKSLELTRRRLPDGSAVWSMRDVTQSRLADAARDDFVTGVAHELRSPLTNIRAYAELLVDDDGVDLEERKNFCNVINDEAVRLSRFIDELLDVSRMEAGALTLTRHVTDIAKLIEDVVGRVGPGLRAKPLTFETSVPAKLPELSVDKDKISAALINLLGNARKYTPEGGKVRLAVEVGEADVTFEIEDSGIGISAEDLPRVFDKFYRAGDDRVHEVTGSGLGLPFVREVARLHGGTATVRSELHHGSVFALTVPLAAVAGARP